MALSQELLERRDIKVLILGYGKEGQSVHRFLRTHYPDLTISIADLNEAISPLFSVDKLHVGEHYLDSISQYNVIFRTPAIPSNIPQLVEAKKSGNLVTSEINLFFSLCKGLTIGITGTKGKSTTSSLIAHFLKQKYPDVRLVGNIGNPALDFLDGANDKSIFVIELSSFQLEDIDHSPHISVILGINEEHFDHHKNLENYLAAKKNIFKFQTNNDFLIFDEDNALTREIVKNAKSKQIGFTLNQLSTILTKHSTTQPLNNSSISNYQLAISNINTKLIGKGIQTNILAASTVVKLLEITDEQIREALKTFQPLPHRLEKLGEKEGITFYDDSISTIPEATINAIEALGNKVQTLIAGGYDRGINYEKLGEFIANSSVENVILFLPSGDRISDSIGKYRTNSKPEIFEVDTMEQAVNLALQHTKAGKICLLSPASASFGTFKDYIDRGNQFRALLGFPPSSLSSF